MNNGKQPIGTLFVVATPIGNLEDISLRALNVLADVDRIICEDTRVTKKLLFHYEISKPLLLYNEHSGADIVDDILRKLADGEDLALVTDAGTPAIADPGGWLVEAYYQRFGNRGGVFPIPGPSAVVAALSAAGVPANRFFFAGYPPHKKGRTKFFTELLGADATVVLYESKHRIGKTLRRIHEMFPKERTVVVARELTKQFEEIRRGTVGDIPHILEDLEQRGEFVVVVGKL